MGTVPLSDRRAGIVAALVAVGYGFGTLVWIVAPAYLGSGGLGALAGDPVAIAFWAGIAIGLGTLAGVPAFLLLQYTLVLPTIAFLVLQTVFVGPEVTGAATEPLMGYIPLLPVYLGGELVLGWLEYSVRQRLGNGWLPWSALP